jgi:hypothetical protein
MMLITLEFGQFWNKDCTLQWMEVITWYSLVWTSYGQDSILETLHDQAAGEVCLFSKKETPLRVMWSEAVHLGLSRRIWSEC